MLNPFCRVDFRYKTWACPCCGTQNQFPAHYASHITEQTLPAELMQEYTTIEYILPQTVQTDQRPIFLLMVDTAIPEEELLELKDSLQQSLNFIPPDALIGLITYGKNVFVHELGFQTSPRAYVFRGDKALSAQDIKTQLGLGQISDPLQKGNAEALKKFFVPVSECEFALNSILDDLASDPWPTKPGNRPKRCSGGALNVAISVLELAGSIHRGSRIISLMGGVVTTGPGQIVGEELKEKIRSHLDMCKNNENTRHFQPATKFYSECAARAQKAGIVIDVFVAALDQVGIIEMKKCFDMTGGFYVMTDSFGNPVFKESFRKFFEADENGELKMGFLAQLKVMTKATDFKVSGAIGQCAMVKPTGNNQAQFISANEVGVGQTNHWYLGGIDRAKSVAIYFDSCGVQQDKKTQQDQRQYACFQFQTTYQHVNSQKRLRVTTVLKNLTATEDLREIAQGFDQEAAAVLVARQAIHKTLSEEPMDAVRWLDRILIKVTKRFADFKAEDPKSFKLSREFSLFPQFIYYLRKSQFLNTFNASPDESEYYKSLMQRESVSNSLVMIQPALMMYKLD